MMKERLGRSIERKDERDFPFYNGIPGDVPNWKWIVIVASCAAAFLMLMFFYFDNEILNIIPRTLFVAIPLVTFIVLVRPDWKAIFKPIRGADIGNIFFFLLLNLVVATAVGLTVRAIFGANPDAATVVLSDLPTAETIGFFIGTGIQIFGEELFTILPFLAVLTWLHRAGVRRNRAVLWSWLITAVWFALAHLPAYGWNLIQVLLVIGVSRLILTAAYMRAKNILTSTGVHILYDWSGFLLLVTTGVHVGTGMM